MNTIIINHSVEPPQQSPIDPALILQIEADTQYLLDHPDLPIPEASEYVHRSKEYAEAFEHTPRADLYLAYTEALHEMRRRVLPFRIVDTVRSMMQTKQYIPNELRPFIPNGATQEEQLQAMEEQVTMMCDAHPQATSLAGRITLLHGTNSSLLAVIPSTDYTMVPTGQLLDAGIAPMSGEISCGGMQANGINQRWISADVIERIDRCWEYATHTSRSFREPTSEQCEQALNGCLERLKKLSPDDGGWDPLMVALLRIKQWRPEEFTKFMEAHAEEIDAAKKAIVTKASALEMQVIKAFEYPIEELQKGVDDPIVREQINQKYFSIIVSWFGTEWWKARKIYFFMKLMQSDDHYFHYAFRDYIVNLQAAIFGFRLFGAHEIEEVLKLYEIPQEHLSVYQGVILDDAEQFKQHTDLSLTVDNVLKIMVRDKIDARIRHNMKPFQVRYERLLRILDPAPPKLLLGPEERGLITTAYPILLGSTKMRPMQSNGSSEYNFPSARLGVEMDLMFVPEDRVAETEKWVHDHNLQMEVYPSTLVDEMQQIPRVHDASQEVSTRRGLDESQHRKLNEQLRDYVFPHYRAPYPDGTKRFWHGVPHAARVAFFSTMLRELYHTAGQKVASTGTNLHIAAGLHDAARQGDGVDLWDQQSGELCVKILSENGTDDAEAQMLGDAIAQKDNPNPTSLDPRIIHDADCLEIMRCLSNPDDFKPEELWALKDLDNEEVYQLIREVRQFIALTDRGVIKEFLETTPEPYKALFQILYESDSRFPLLRALGKGGVGAFYKPSDSILPANVLEIVQQ